MRKTRSNKAVIITGASGGIGMACVRAFLAEGDCVVMADLDDSGGKFATRTGSRRCRFVHTDISDEKSVQRLLVETVKAFGRLDVLVNNAAVLTPIEPVHKTTLAEFDKLVAVNIRGAFLCCKYAIPHLKRSRGSIINISSMAGVVGEKSHAVYSATKGALNSLTRAMAIDYGPEKIRINAVCPAGVKTPASEKVMRAAPDAAKVVKLRDSIHSVGYTASPAQIASVAVFLASPAASFMTGAIVPVSGGSECGYGIKY